MRSQLIAFFRAPFDQLAQAVSLGDRVKVLLKILLLDLGLAMLAGVVIGLVNQLGVVDMDNHAVVGALQQFSLWQLMLIAVLGTPLLEELIFRLPLRYQTNPIAGLARVFTPKTTPENDAQLAAKRRAWWDRNYHYIFYSLVTAFAFVHLTNYPNITLGLLLLSPLLVAPQFIMGMFAGFLRVRFGFWWAFALHALHNFILVGFALLGSGDTEIILVDTDDLRLAVEEVSPLNQDINHAHTFGTDTVAYVNTPLNEVIRTLSTTSPDAVVLLPDHQANPRLNVELKQLSDSTSPKAFLLDTLLSHYNLSVLPELPGDTLRLVQR